MMRKDFDPRKFIDREFEQQLFENMLELASPTRILAIRDQGGMGKTQLLEKLQYRCRITRPRRVPVCLLSLDEFPSDAILPVLQSIERQLSSFGLDFHNFRRLENARLSADFLSIRSSINLEGALFEGTNDTRIAAMMFNTERIERMNVSISHIDLTPEQDAVAQDVIIRAFYADLRRHCTQGLIVFLIDAYEKCNPGIHHWLYHDLLEQLYFHPGRHPESLILVIAGRDIPPFDMHWPIEECNQVVCTVQKLSRWERRHIEECLRVHGFTYEISDLDSFQRLVEIGIPPSQIVQLIWTALSVRGNSYEQR